MSWIKDVFARWQMNTAQPMGRVDSQSANVANQSQMNAQDPRHPGLFLIGKVLDSAAGAYYCIVRAKGAPDLPCVALGAMNSLYMGANESNLPIEGSQVLVHKPHPEANYGIIVGVLPGINFNDPSSSGQVPWYYSGLWDNEPGASGCSEDAYDLPITDPNDSRNLEANATRALDAFPGDWSLLNDRDVGFTLGRLMATVRGSDRARIDVSLIDDQVRIISGHFRHIHCQGELSQCNDGGYLTTWISLTSHQCEKSGQKEYGQKITKEVDSDTGLLQKSDAAAYDLIQPDLMPKRRLQIIHGWLGDILSLFVAKPDPDMTPERYSNDSKDQGLCQMHIDASGRLLVRSAGGISLQRWDRIPVPKQKYELWDPEGDKIEQGYEPKEKKPVEWPDEHKYARNLMMRDANAWRVKQSYKRVHDQSTKAGKKDIYLPDEQELKTPDRKYDELGKGEEDYEKYDLRNAYVNIEEDGSIVMRDAWGSEIYLRGGNIIFNCAGQIEVRPGKSLVMLAGDDLVAKAKNSVDITATDKDVRVKAEGNLHMLAEGREGKGGILIESRADGEGVAFTDLKGEDVVSRGIILRATKSAIYSQARTLHSSAERMHKIECWGEDESNNGMILLSGRKLLSHMRQQTQLITDKGAGLIIGRGQAALSAGSVVVWGGRSISIGKAQKAWIPFMQVPIPINLYESFRDVFAVMYDWLQETPWLTPFLPSDRDQIQFTYRTAIQYNTKQATEVHEPPTSFRVYQGTWAFLKDVGYHTLESMTKDKWIEYEIDGTWPWPGEEAYSGGQSYFKLQNEKHILDPAKGIMKDRESITDPKPAEPQGYDFNEYEITLI